MRFTWAEVRAEALRPRPRIAFERGRGWGRVPAWFITWTTALFAPWILARQSVACVRLPRAAQFAAVCGASTLASLFFGADAAFIAAWLVAALACILVETIVFTLLDPLGRLDLRGGGLYWLCIGGYTSAVMVLEFRDGPPVLGLTDLIQFIAPNAPTWAFRWAWSFPSVSFESAIHFAQLALWCAALACCFFTRCRKAGYALLAALLWLPAIVALSLVIYGTMVEHVGSPIYRGLTGR
ncbi:MAG: hypothetical protein U1D55_09420 [Phycisphaerae bacterium]